MCAQRANRVGQPVPATQQRPERPVVTLCAGVTQERDFAQRHEPDKVVAILAKTWAKMSDTGRAAALRLDLAPPVRGLLDQATAQAPDAGSSEEPAAS